MALLRKILHANIETGPLNVKFMNIIAICTPMYLILMTVKVL